MFKEKSHQKEFDEFGYVKLELFNKEDLAYLNSVYEETKGLVELNQPFYTSIWSENESYKNKVDQEIKKVFLKRLDKYITNFKTVFGNFMVKKQSRNSDLNPHQDWNFVNEENSYTITIWAPLSNVNKSNGALEIFPKSHIKFKNFIRPRFADSVFLDELNYIKENCMECVEMNAGEALFVNSRTIHGSSINCDSKERIAATLVVADKKEPLVHYVELKDKKEIVKLNIEPSFFIKYSCYDNPI